ncbi:caspase family protein [Leptothermofonsia sichuanensis E412]|uniref:nSTAND1 domain-containing NTPase n=1 Tax=Leptothermofonsia sichuanensis TaxID=2917832 RepID=UPI001CA61B97|nr:caspase family protein [Leptothermofonsia sichuanensis]QZZ21918.1 caspase family protein [Leptothermofonsia sichuanensis E412]
MSRDALVVGINAYQWLPGLKAPAHDAEAIAQQLQINGDFRVTRMPDIIQAGQSTVGAKTLVSLAELEAALVRLFKPKGNNIPHTALFYFSGHGLQKDAGIQEGYLATSDANPNAGFYGLSLFWLRRLLQESPVKQRIILLDCCHSGELLNFLEADPGARAGTDRLFMAASREYEMAYEAIEGKYSVFTQALIEGLDPGRVPTGTVTNYALTDWVSNALKTETQQPLFENSGSEIVLTRCQGAPTLLKTELSQEICPYRGLECFDEAHAEYFFGREDLTDQLIEKLKTRNFVAVVGASGSGKSSLVRAGLIHQLRQGHKFSGSDRWRIQLITPTDQPLRSLASAFVNSQAPTVDRAEHLRRAEALLQEGGNGLSHLVRASLISSKYGRNSRLLLIIDQFEEVFTLCQGPQAERDRHRFFNSLLTAMLEASDCLSIIIVLRADFFGKCSLYNGLAEQIEQNLVTVTPLTYEQIKASVVKPAQKVGAICDPNLVYNILLDVVGAPGELPLLQYTLLELWRQRQPDPDGGPDRLTLDAYTELGGVRGTLQKRADEIFYSLSLEEQQVAKRIFIALTQLGDGTEDTRRRVLKSELVSPRFPVELVDRVLEKLVTAKLVVTNQIVSNRYQERVDQSIASVSTALRLAQMCQGKFPKANPATPEFSTRLQSVGLQGEHLLNRITQLPTNHLAERCYTQTSCAINQETVDVAHETLIRHWSMLRFWLDENREMLRRQRRIEHAAREWQNADEPRSNDYLLHGDRLIDAEDYLKTFPDELSALAHRFITVSREETRRIQKELRLLQMVIPCTLLVALGVTLNQYMTSLKSQTEKDYQLQIATSRQQAAIAQSILQEPDGDPTTALLISRLAAEKGGRTYEAQASLRSALKRLRLQAYLQGKQGKINQVAFSPNQPYLATAGEDGTVQLWSLKTESVEKVLRWAEKRDGEQESENSQSEPRSSSAIKTISFSPDGRLLAAIAVNSGVAQVWSVESGALLYQLEAAGGVIKQLVFSPDGEWIATVDDQPSVRIWQVNEGKPGRQLSHKAEVQNIAFSPDGQQVLTVSGNTVQLWQVSTGQAQQVLSQPGKVRHAAFSPSGLQVSTVSNDGMVRLWQIDETKSSPSNSSPQPRAARIVEQFTTHSESLEQTVFSPDGTVVAAIDQHHRFWLWDIRSGRLRLKNTQIGKGDVSSGQTAIAFSPDNQYVVTAGFAIDNQEPVPVARLWNLHTAHLVETLKGHSDAISSVQFSSDGALIATASADGSIRLWATEVGSEFPTLKMAGEKIQWVTFRNPRSEQMVEKFDPSRTTAAIASSRHAITKNQSNVEPLSPRGFGELVTVAMDGTIRNWSFPHTPPSGNASRTYSSHSLAELHSPESLKNTGSNFLKWVGESISLLKPKNEGQSARWMMSRIKGESQAVLQTASPTADGIPTGSTGDSSRSPVHQTTTAKVLNKLPAGTKLTGVGFSPDGHQMATATESGNIQIWSIQSNGSVSALRQIDSPFRRKTQAAQSHQAPAQSIRQLAFTPDAQKLLGVGDDRLIYLWDVQSGKLMTRLKGHTAAIEQAQFSSDGQLVVSASRDRTARIWQVSNGALLNTLPHRNAVSSIQFSLDNQLVITASLDGTARVLDAKTGAMRVLLAGHRGPVLDAKFSPDGQRLVTTSADGTARLWDAETGTEEAILRPVEDNSEPIQQAFFSPDGQYIATLSQSGKLYVWATTWDGLLRVARDRSLRQLQPEECLRYLRLPPNACPPLEVKK